MIVEKKIHEGAGERCDQVIISFESKSCVLKCPPTSFSGIKFLEERLDLSFCCVPVFPVMQR